jgi:hypothetical protein
MYSGQQRLIISTPFFYAFGPKTIKWAKRDFYHQMPGYPTNVLWLVNQKNCLEAIDMGTLINGFSKILSQMLEQKKATITMRSLDRPLVFSLAPRSWIWRWAHRPNFLLCHGKSSLKIVCRSWYGMLMLKRDWRGKAELGTDMIPKKGMLQ